MAAPASCGRSTGHSLVAEMAVAVGPEAAEPLKAVAGYSRRRVGVERSHFAVAGTVARARKWAVRAGEGPILSYSSPAWAGIVAVAAVEIAADPKRRVGAAVGIAVTARRKMAAGAEAQIEAVAQNFVVAAVVAGKEVAAGRNLVAAEPAQNRAEAGQANRYLDRKISFDLSLIHI